MFAEELISPDIFPLKKSDTCETAILFMHDWKVFHLPVVDSGKLLGYVSHDEIQNKSHASKIEKFIQPLIQLYIHKGQHLFDIIKQMTETGFTCMAVSDAEANYSGTVSTKEIAQVYKNSSLSQPGGIISIEMNPQDYSLGEIARIVEYNDAKILHVFISAASENKARIIVSLKLNKLELNTVVQTLERYQYIIHSVHQISDQGNDLSNRYDWLIKYLNT
jgi:acetoin utilization protein AcuB